MSRLVWPLAILIAVAVAGCGGSGGGLPGLTGPPGAFEAEFQFPESSTALAGPFTISVVGSEIEEARFEVDGELIATDVESPFIFTVTPSDFAVGSHVVSIVATAGEETVSAQATIRFAEPEPIDEVAAQDWATRAGASGVTMATNFDASREVFDFAVDEPEHYAWERSIRKSGNGALKILIPSSDTTSGWDWWRFLSDDMEPFGSKESGLRDEYYVSFSIYIPQTYYDWVFAMGDPADRKFSIISQKPSASVNPVTRARLDFVSATHKGSSVTNELVLNDIGHEMWPMVYVQSRGYSARAFVFPNRPNRYDFSLFNVVDEGVKTGTPLAYQGDDRDQATRDLVAQFGPHYAYAGSGWGSGLTQGALRSKGAAPHPDPIAAGKSWRVGWNTVKMHVKFPSTWTGTDGLFELSLFHDGDSSWTKLVSVRGDHPTSPFLVDPPSEVKGDVPYNDGVDGWYHVGIWLTPYRTGGKSETGVRPDTYLLYDELITSTKDIAPPSAGK